MKAKRGRRGEDGRTELSKPVLGSLERALVSDLANAIYEIKSHTTQVRRCSECRRLTANDVHQRSPEAK